MFREELYNKVKKIPVKNFIDVQPDHKNPYYYDVPTKLGGDVDVPGFAKGMDDLGQIILNAKKEVKFNRNLLTDEGVKYWLAKKNAKIKGNKKWTYAHQDINGDGIPEYVLRDGNGLIRYINGFGVGNSKHKINTGYQKYIDKFGDPYERMVKKAIHDVKKGEMTKRAFMYKNTRQDDENPDGALIPIDILRDVKYEPRAPSACNLFLSYITKKIYNDLTTQELGISEEQRKALSRVYGMLQANAMAYGMFVTNPVNKWFNERGISPKDAKKKREGMPTLYAEKCLKQVRAVYRHQPTKDKIKEVIRKQLEKVINDKLKVIHEEQDYQFVNPRVLTKGGPDITSYIKNYKVKGNKQRDLPPNVDEHGYAPFDYVINDGEEDVQAETDNNN